MDVKLLQILPVMLKVFIYPLPTLEFSLEQHVLDNPKIEREHNVVPAVPHHSSVMTVHGYLDTRALN